MTTLCPTCNNSLDRKHHEAIGEDVLRCRVCRAYSVEGSGSWLSDPDVIMLRVLIKRRDDDKARHELFMTSDINHPIWTNLS